MTTLLLLIPTLPAAAALLVLLLGERLPRGGGWLATAGVLTSAVGLGVLATTGVLHGEVLLAETTWMRVGPLELTVGLLLDGLSWWTATLVACVSLLVTLYAVAYMDGERGRPRFFALMAFFAASMLALVLSSSFVLLFMAWEGVGLASYGLIGFHYEERESRDAARKAFLMTRLGDGGLLLGWLLVLVLTGSTGLGTFEAAVTDGTFAPATLALMAFLFLVAAVGKSAQLPLTAWLPDAMAGPTPVSALLHSATMVAAGVYLVLRVFPLFEAAPLVREVLLWTGALTALVAALVATAQYDLKRVLAWSTVSQIGEMMLALGLASPVAAAFHLTTHAVFKSALFLVAGAVDQGTGSRDLRELGGLGRALPLSAGVFGVSALALAGFPPLAGFWSEEAILGAAQALGAGWGVLMLALVLLAGIYIGRAGWAVFGGRPQSPEPEAERPGWILLAPMLVLAAAAAALGYALKTPVEEVLAFAKEPHTLGLWRWLAIGASAVGLGFGAWRVRSAGPVPALGGFVDRLGTGVHALARAPVPVVLSVARGLSRIEQGLDGLARRTAAGAVHAARAVDGGEHGLDRAARGTAAATLRAAQGTDAAERRGFSDGMDGLAIRLRHGGDRLRGLQTGIVYQYAMGLFVYVLLAVALVTIIVWIG